VNRRMVDFFFRYGWDKISAPLFTESKLSSMATAKPIGLGCLMVPGTSIMLQHSKRHWNLQCSSGVGTVMSGRIGPNWQKEMLDSLTGRFLLLLMTRRPMKRYPCTGPISTMLYVKFVLEFIFVPTSRRISSLKIGLASCAAVLFSRSSTLFLHRFQLMRIMRKPLDIHF
jgi:hypothetical protein